MNTTDDIFDIEDFIKRKGTPEIKKQWKRHLEWHYQLDRNDSKYRQVISAMGTLQEVLKDVSDV